TGFHSQARTARPALITPAGPVERRAQGRPVHAGAPTRPTPALYGAGPRRAMARRTYAPSLVVRRFTPRSSTTSHRRSGDNVSKTIHISRDGSRLDASAQRGRKDHGRADGSGNRALGRHGSAWTIRPGAGSGFLHRHD